MSFIGNFAAAQSAKAIGQYNQGVYYQQAAYARKKAAVNQKTYDQVTKPLLLRKFKKPPLVSIPVGAKRLGSNVGDSTPKPVGMLE